MHVAIPTASPEIRQVPSRRNPSARATLFHVGPRPSVTASSVSLLAAGIAARRTRRLTTSVRGLQEISEIQYDDGKRYEIFFDQILGSGAQGTVYRGLSQDGTAVAIKVIPTWRLILEPGFEDRKMASIEAELDTLRMIGKHPNIAGLLSTASVDDVDSAGKVRPRYKVVVMEVVDGKELAEHIALNGPLRESVARHIFLQVLDGLAHMHKRGIIHRDLKPENVMVTGEFIDLESQVKLIDFGVAKCLNHGPLKTVVGTPSIMAPEVAKAKLGHVGATHASFSWDGPKAGLTILSSPSTDARSDTFFSPKVDVWSAGICLFTCLTGKLPFRTELEIIRSHYDRDALVHCSEEAKDLLQKMLQKEVSQRPTIDECLAHPWVPCSETDGCTIDWDNLPDDEFEYDPLGA
mmetsp:Transcript_67358/g.158730  ORF Transcript_67358/g.158730 Transcript_67358/m.158730 type:complete len:407 (+) Transcript_67358:29-1249(+)